MRRLTLIFSYLIVVFLTLHIWCCSKSEVDNGSMQNTTENPNDSDGDDISGGTETTEYADINFSNWKVTLPVDEDDNGRPDEYQPNELLNLGYQNIDAVKPFMYDDTEDASLVFYAYPESTTPNSSYSRTELRELINPSNSRENWSLQEGGEMTGRLKIQEVSNNASESSFDFHRIIVIQIHGVISQEDMDIHGFSSNNGPPLIKIYWKDGYVWSHKKSLVNESTSGDDLLTTSSSVWTDIKVNLGYVGYDAFDFRITASDAKIEVQLNEDEPNVYEDISLDKWPFENYFKAGNYLITTDEGAFSYLKYYNLYITH